MLLHYFYFKVIHHTYEMKYSHTQFQITDDILVLGQLIIMFRPGKLYSIIYSKNSIIFNKDLEVQM